LCKLITAFWVVTFCGVPFQKMDKADLSEMRTSFLPDCTVSPVALLYI